jgi:hypothetical protein
MYSPLGVNSGKVTCSAISNLGRRFEDVGFRGMVGLDL